ncbi:hypothetical protein HPB47_001923 [Ixodes persulcatus]|uniref:Uncharacterized protein n=1 Tax=Ixodes persulcatus TaxID=34615 RepID=A0AC60PP75_IXOPE|nr:hypothetical protein HPB47_001923 [Ixodes persulcatus]
MVHNQSLRWYYAAVAQALEPFKENLVAPLFAMEVSSFEDKLAHMVHKRPLVAVQTLAALAPELREFLDIVLENIAKVTPTTELLVKSPQYVKDLFVLVKSTAPHIVLNYLGFREIVVAAPFLPEKLHGLSALGRSSLLRKYVCLEIVAESLPVMSLYASSHAFKQGLQDFTNSNVSVAAKHVVTELVSKMNWMDKRTKDEVKKKFLDIVLENIAQVTPTTELLVKSPQYVKDLFVLVKSTAPHIVLNYLGFREIVVAAPFLPEKLHGLSALGRSSLLRKYVCLEIVAESLPVMSLYASSHAFKQGLQDFTNSNVSVAAKHVVTELVSKMNWMDKRTKDEVKKKVPTICEGDGLRSYVSIRKSLFENKMKGEASRINERLAHIPGTVSKLSHCLVELLLDEGAGSSTGHQVNYTQTAWSAGSRKKFDDLQKCFANQYSLEKHEDAATPSLQDFLSVMADNGAITPTIKVFKDYISRNQIDENSFKTVYNMTSDQFFFVAYVSNFCDVGAANPGRQRSTISNRDRVNIALKNSREFQDAFKCPAKRSMNPSRKCHLWSP